MKHCRGRIGSPYLGTVLVFLCLFFDISLFDRSCLAKGLTIPRTPIMSLFSESGSVSIPKEFSALGFNDPGQAFGIRKVDVAIESFFNFREFFSEDEQLDRIRKKNSERVTDLFRQISTIDYSKMDPAPRVLKWGTSEFHFKNFGDLVKFLKRVQSESGSIESGTRILSRDYPEIWREVRDFLPLIFPGISLKQDQARNPFQSFRVVNGDSGIANYSAIKRQDKISSGREGREYQQIGLFINADLNRIKTVERDMEEYRRFSGLHYVAALPSTKKHFFGVDEKGDEFFSLEIYFCQKPQKFLRAVCFTMKMIDYFDVENHFVNEYYTLPEGDLHWMAGRDTFFKINSSDGEFLGFLIASECGFDIKWIPETNAQRSKSLVRFWANIKERAESPGKRVHGN